MVIETICEVVSLRVQQFATGGRIGIIPKSLTSAADAMLDETLGLPLHRLDFSATRTPEDYAELEQRIRDEPQDVRVLVKNNGFTRSFRTLSRLRTFSSKPSHDAVGCWVRAQFGLER